MKVLLTCFVTWMFLAVRQVSVASDSVIGAMYSSTLSQWYTGKTHSGYIFLQTGQVPALSSRPLDTMLKLELSLQNALPMYINLTSWDLEGIAHQHKFHGLQSEFAFCSEPPHHSIHSDEPLVGMNKRYRKTKLSVCEGKISHHTLIPFFFLSILLTCSSFQKKKMRRKTLYLSYTTYKCEIRSFIISTH